MAKRDPEKTARNKIDREISAELKKMLPEVLKVTKFDSEYSLHGKIGGKYANFIDIKNEVIFSSDHFISLWLQGYQEVLETGSGYSSAYDLYELLRKNAIFKDYLFLFLKRTYIRYYEALSKKKPLIEESEIWIGQENANYGILITPRFTASGWENDKSEIRHFKPKYWSVGHILETGLLIPSMNKRMDFKDVNEYLDFFKYVIVRNSGSKYELELAELYSNFVQCSTDPEDIPLLIPEYRYGGLQKKHKYRLDFTIIEPVYFNKIGFEISPWSTHGYINKTKELSQKEINQMASDNFEKEMRKHKDYFKKYGIFTLIYTDSDLEDVNSIFNDMKKYLTPKSVKAQLRFHIFDNFFK